MAAKSMPTSLQDFAAAQANPKAQCRVCLLPLEVRTMLAADTADGLPTIPATIKAKWLAETHGFEITPEALRRHLSLHAVTP